jgi:hypothetical protein
VSGVVNLSRHVNVRLILETGWSLLCTDWATTVAQFIQIYDPSPHIACSIQMSYLRIKDLGLQYWKILASKASGCYHLIALNANFLLFLLLLSFLLIFPFHPNSGCTYRPSYFLNFCTFVLLFALWSYLSHFCPTFGNLTYCPSFSMKFPNFFPFMRTILYYVLD